MKVQGVTGSRESNLCSHIKKDSVSLVLRIEEEIWTKHDALDVMNLGIIKEIVLNLKGQEK